MTYVAVDPTFRRKGVGKALIARLISKLNDKRSRLVLFVSEYNLELQLFLKGVGFKAVQVRRTDEGNSEYKFQYELNSVVVV